MQTNDWLLFLRFERSTAYDSFLIFLFAAKVLSMLLDTSVTQYCQFAIMYGIVSKGSFSFTS